MCGVCLCVYLCVCLGRFAQVCWDSRGGTHCIPVYVCVYVPTLNPYMYTYVYIHTPHATHSHTRTLHTSESVAGKEKSTESERERERERGPQEAVVDEIVNDDERVAALLAEVVVASTGGHSSQDSGLVSSAGGGGVTVSEAGAGGGGGEAGRSGVQEGRLEKGGGGGEGTTPSASAPWAAPLPWGGEGVHEKELEAVAVVGERDGREGGGAERGRGGVDGGVGPGVVGGKGGEREGEWCRGESRGIESDVGIDGLPNSLKSVMGYLSLPHPPAPPLLTRLSTLSSCFVSLRR
jgi:hypothetical protein